MSTFLYSEIFLWTVKKTLSFIFKGRFGSFIAYGDPLILYTGGHKNERTADNERMGELVLVTPHNLNTDLTECGCPEVQ